MIKTKPTHKLLRACIGILMAGGVFLIASCEDENQNELSDTEMAKDNLPVLIEPMGENQMTESEQIFEVVDEQPRPAGGMEAFYKFVGEELRYPAQANRMGVEGRVFVQFIVDEQGNVSEVKTVKGIGAGCDAEAERVLRLVKWEPGKQKGRPVKVRMIMPIMFKLAE